MRDVILCAECLSYLSGHFGRFFVKRKNMTLTADILPGKSNQRLLESITLLTAQIEENYPELYHYLDENAQLHSYALEQEPSLAELKDHLSTLKQYLRHHIETHHANKYKARI
jgi:hypothetical protein